MPNKLTRITTHTISINNATIIIAAINKRIRGAIKIGRIYTDTTIIKNSEFP